MEAIMEDHKYKKEHRNYVLTMLGIVILVVAVSLVTILGTSSSTATGTRSTPQSFLATAPNNTANPVISVSCEKPVLTVALMLDRSGSVYNDSKGAAPQQYKDTVNSFLTKLSSLINSRHGEVNVLLYAFGGRSVLQNKIDATNEPITTISDTNSLNDMKNVVDRIWFSQPDAIVQDYNHNGTIEPEEKIGMQASNDAYDVRRGYNPGSDEQGYFSTTNWDDALLSVADIGKSSYSNPSPGGHIDLALMLTDGQPNANNGDNRTFEASDTLSYNSAKGRVFSAKTVSELRTGISSRPPMMVRGLLVNSTDVSAMDQVFGVGNYSTATNFDADLDEELNKVIDKIDNDIACQPTLVTPSISLDITPASVTVDEGGAPRIVTITIKNTSTATKAGAVVPGLTPTLYNVVIDINGEKHPFGNIDGTHPITYNYAVQAPYGTTNTQSYNVKVTAEFIPSGTTLKLAPGVSSTAIKTGSFVRNVNIAAFPA